MRPEVGALPDPLQPHGHDYIYSRSSLCDGAAAAPRHWLRSSPRTPRGLSEQGPRRDIVCVIRLEVSMQTQLVPVPIVTSGPSSLPRFLGQHGLHREHWLPGGGASPRGLHLPAAHPPPLLTAGHGGSAPGAGGGGQAHRSGTKRKKGSKDSHHNTHYFNIIPVSQN